MEKNSDIDNELLFLIEENNSDAQEFLVEKYYDLVSYIAKKYKSLAKSTNIEYVDLHQEGLLGLLEAINTYDKEKGIKFNTYASACIDNKIKTYFRHNFAKKNIFQKSALSLDTNEYSDMNLYDYILDDKENPEDKILYKDLLYQINNELKKTLNEKEYNIYIMRIKGYRNEEISQELGINKRNVENIIFKINKKIKKFSI